MRKGNLKYIIDENLTIIADYIIEDEELILNLKSPYNLKYKNSYIHKESYEGNEVDFAIHELIEIMKKVFFVERHITEFEQIINEYFDGKNIGKVEIHNGEESYFFSTYLIGRYLNLLDIFIKKCNEEVSWTTYFVEPELVREILTALRKINQTEGK